MQFMFDDSGLSTENYDRTLIGWAGRSLNDDVELGAPGIEYCNSEPFQEHLEAEYNWTITKAGQATDCPTTQIRFDASAFGGINDANDITVYSRPMPFNGDFAPVNNFFYDEDTGEIVAETGSFSEFIFASDTNPLPVELSVFNATLNGEDAVLTWETVSETGNAGFEVQRAPVGPSDAQWTALRTVDGAGTTDTPQSYRFTDTDLPYTADSLRYRLRQIDVDGTESFSETVTIARQVTQAELLPTYPNPVRGQATICFAVPNRQTVRIALYDMLGRRVQMVTNGPASRCWT